MAANNIVRFYRGQQLLEMKLEQAYAEQRRLDQLIEEADVELLSLAALKAHLEKPQTATMKPIPKEPTFWEYIVGFVGGLAIIYFCLMGIGYLTAFLGGGNLNSSNQEQVDY